MLRSLRSRRRPHYGAQICAAISAVLLLLSVSLLYGRLSYHTHQPHLVHSGKDSDSAAVLHQNPLLSDSDESNQNDDVTDKIDELDTFEEQKDATGFRNDDDESGTDTDSAGSQIPRRSGYYMDHVTGSIRRALNKRSIEEWDYESNSFNLGFSVDDRSKGAFASDDIPIDEDVRRKVSEVEGIEDALLLKIGKRVSPLRIGWGDWFDKKGDFLRRDRMFKSNFEVLNPLSNPLLQDPDGVGVTGLSRGDKAVQKLLLSEFKRTPFLVKSPARVSKMTNEEDNSIRDGNRARIKMAERRMFDDLDSRENGNAIEGDTKSVIKSVVKADLSNRDSKVQPRKSEELNYIYADGKRWGYFPGLKPHLSFSEFLDSFFRHGECLMRVFMVWNSPPWMYTVRQQRGLESLLLHHRDACVVMLSETIELDFFAKSFVKDGYKVAVAMPNLEELLKDTPASIFADVWFDWRKTKYYSTHYSELVRLAALYTYGGIYLDSDIIVLNSLSSLNNTVGLEGQLAKSSLNGAVMAFTKNSVFILECLKEFYKTYDDTRLRWNGADLLTRVAMNFLGEEGKSSKQQELKLQPSYIFFPIASQDITSYFTEPTIETEKAHQDALYDKILKESLTFHFWNSLTFSLIPEPGSLVARLIDSFCIRCSYVL